MVLVVTLAVSPMPSAVMCCLSQARDKLRKDHAEFERSLNDIQQQLEHSRQV